MRDKLRIAFGVLLLLIGIGCILYAGIMQMVLCYQKFGVIISSEHFFIPHWSAWFYFGIIPFATGNVILGIDLD